MTKEEKIKEVMEEVKNLWDWSATRATPSLQMKQFQLIESKLRKLLEDTQ